MQGHTADGGGREQPHGQPEESHDHHACVIDALAAAGEVCAARGAQLTTLRRRVLELIWSSHRSVKAYDLMERLGTEGKPAKPPTVYRALDFLIEQGLVHKVESLNAYVGCPHPTSPHEGQFLICIACGRVDEMRDPAVRAAIRAGAQAAGYVPEGQTIEVRGRCARCRS